MNVLIVGGRGRLGQKLIEVFSRETDWRISSAIRGGVADDDGIKYFDTTSKYEWRNLIEGARWRPDVIINAAGITNVDECERQRAQAWQANVELTEILVDIARRSDAHLVQLSTDHVFNGEAGPYSEIDVPDPINYYGKTKLAAENACKQSADKIAIVRTMWLYGTSIDSRQNFVDWVLQRVSQRRHAAIASDEIGNPTLTDDVAYGILRVVESGHVGLLHMAGAERISRLQFARRIAAEWGFSADVLEPCNSARLNRLARRPLSSGLLSLRAEAILGVTFTGATRGLKAYRINTKRRLHQ